jgi:glycosyltransferase involved in cell wall biosynthesis
VLIHTPTFGGPHNQMIRLNQPLRKCGWRLIVVLPNEEGDGYSRLKNSGVDVYKKNMGRLRASSLSCNIDYLLNIRKEINDLVSFATEKNIEIVQVCGLMHIHGAIVAKIVKKPLVWQLLSTFAPKVLRAIYTPIIGALADAVMSTGEIIVKKHPFNFQIWNKLVPFYPPVDTNTFIRTEEKRSIARKALGLPVNGFVIGTVGNQNRQKSHEKFVQIARRYKNNSGFYFRIIGNSTDSQRNYYNREVIDLAEKYRLFDNEFLKIQQLGNLSVDQVLSAFDLFIITSFAEGVPTVILEAMSIGLPVISTDVGSIPEIVKNNENGFLYKFGDLDYLKKLIDILYNDNSLRDSISLENRKDAVNDFDIVSCTKKHCLAYEKSIESCFG